MPTILIDRRRINSVCHKRVGSPGFIPPEQQCVHGRERTSCTRRFKTNNESHDSSLCSEMSSAPRRGAGTGKWGIGGARDSTCKIPSMRMLPVLAFVFAAAAASAQTTPPATVAAPPDVAAPPAGATKTAPAC
jgi:hypothetical protein